MPDSNLVAWPSGDSVRDTGEDGMAVVAYWPSGTIWGPCVPLADVIPRGHRVDDVDRVFPGYMRQCTDPQPGPVHEYRSFPLTALMVLGHTTRSLWDVTADQYWVATRDRLTAAGRRLLEQLEEAHGGPAVLLTHLST